MGHDKEHKNPHEPEVPDTRFVITTKSCSQPIELHGFVNGPTRKDRQEPGDRNGEIRDALKCVVFCVEARMQPSAAYESGNGENCVIANHRQCIAQVGPSGQQRSPATSNGRPYNEDEAVQHEEIRTEPMKAESRGEQAGTEAHVVVDPVWWIAVLMQPWYMRAYPNTNVRKRIEIPGQWIRFVLIDRRCLINGHATQKEAQKDWHVQPVAAPHQQMVPANYKHAGLGLRHA